ncbi:formylglycine-generating enzyme family protein [Bdellovibrio sp. HCB117]|uniref:formylglycine-generating enzyme family protein n=1 Tax=Bdellovibrio sp. HCB117 TaxID=3394359 RepID=UPI0039B385BF
MKHYQRWILAGMMIVLPCLAKATDRVLIPAGEFKMPAVLSKKSIPVKAFYLDRDPVTNKEFLEFIKLNPEWAKSKTKRIFADKNYLNHWSHDFSYEDSRYDKMPVVQVSWYAARSYCFWKGGRLPTIAEWEYVALFPFPGGPPLQSLILEWYGKSSEWPLPAVMSGRANSAGIYDLHGLIWEWVEDFNSSLVTGESRADSALDKNLFCGAGSAGAADPSDYAAFMRYAFRSSLKAAYTVQNLGFRCAQDKEPL